MLMVQGLTLADLRTSHSKITSFFVWSIRLFAAVNSTEDLLFPSSNTRAKMHLVIMLDDHKLERG